MFASGLKFPEASCMRTTRALFGSEVSTECFPQNAFHRMLSNEFSLPNSAQYVSLVQPAWASQKSLPESLKA